jgi:hypothetical protein
VKGIRMVLLSTAFMVLLACTCNMCACMGKWNLVV